MLVAAQTKASPEKEFPALDKPADKPAHELNDWLAHQANSKATSAMASKPTSAGEDRAKIPVLMGLRLPMGFAVLQLPCTNSKNEDIINKSARLQNLSDKLSGQ